MTCGVGKECTKPVTAHFSGFSKIDSRLKTVFQTRCNGMQNARLSSLELTPQENSDNNSDICILPLPGSVSVCLADVVTASCLHQSLVLMVCCKLIKSGLTKH